MTLLAQIKDAEFWHQGVCLGCGSAVEPPADECPECGETEIVSATSLMALLRRILDESDE